MTGICTMCKEGFTWQWGGSFGECVQIQITNESAPAFSGCSIPPSKANQHCDAAHCQAQVANVKEIYRGQPKDPCQDSPSELDIDTQATEDHTTHL